MLNVCQFIWINMPILQFCSMYQLCLKLLLGCLHQYFLDNPDNRLCTTCYLFKCTACTDGPTCISCEPGYFWNTVYKQCMPCYFPCKNCNIAATNCTSCQITTRLYFFNSSSNRCQLCYHILPSCS